MCKGAANIGRDLENAVALGFEVGIRIGRGPIPERLRGAELDEIAHEIDLAAAALDLAAAGDFDFWTRYEWGASLSAIADALVGNHVAEWTPYSATHLCVAVARPEDEPEDEPEERNYFDDGPQDTRDLW